MNDIPGGTEGTPMLYTIRRYPCGCSAEGPGDVPAYCAEHDPQYQEPCVACGRTYPHLIDAAGRCQDG